MKKIALVLALVAGQLAFTAQAHARHGDGAAIVGGLIVGGIIGAAINESSHRHYDDADWVCKAHNWRGESFRAVGFSRRHAADKVMNKCYAYSRKCWIDSCYVR